MIKTTHLIFTVKQLKIWTRPKHTNFINILNTNWHQTYENSNPAHCKKMFLWMREQNTSHTPDAYLQEVKLVELLNYRFPWRLMKIHIAGLDKYSLASEKNSQRKTAENCERVKDNRKKKTELTTTTRQLCRWLITLRPRVFWIIQSQPKWRIDWQKKLLMWLKLKLKTEKTKKKRRNDTKRKRKFSCRINQHVGWWWRHTVWWWHHMGLVVLL